MFKICLKCTELTHEQSHDSSLRDKIQSALGQPRLECGHTVQEATDQSKYTTEQLLRIKHDACLKFLDEADDPPESIHLAFAETKTKLYEIGGMPDDYDGGLLTEDENIEWTPPYAE